MEIELTDNLKAVILETTWSEATKATWGYYGGEPAYPSELEDFEFYLEYCALDGTVTESSNNRFKDLLFHKIADIID
jgi:hypothetical protein